MVAQEFELARGFGPRKNKALIDKIGEVVETFTEATSGVATVLAGATTAVVTHGAPSTPAPQDILARPATAWGSATTWWIDTITATQFTIHVNIAPGGAGMGFVWAVLSLS